MSSRKSNSNLVHTVKFYEVKPLSITNLCYNENLQILAAVRSDSSIELWDVRSSAHIDRTLLPQKGISIECITWSDARLFAGSLQGSVVEYDLLNLCSINSLPVTSGTCWCLVSNKSNTLLAAGTEAGYINILSTENDGLMFEKLLDKQEGQVLCLAWDLSENFLVSGSVDALRLWDVKTGQANFKMTTGRSENNQPTIIWCVCVTDDFTIISGDSRGKLCFWDGHMGTAISSYQTHKADILAIIMSKNQSTLYCAGVDPLIVTFEKTNLTGERMTWVKSVQRVIHDHDVKALALADNQLFSAGVDGYLALSSYLRSKDKTSLLHIQPYQQSNKILYKYPPFLQPPRAVVSEEARCILLRFKTSVEIWKLGAAQPNVNMKGPDKMNLEIKDDPKKLLELHSIRNQAIRCSTLSPDAKFVAYSTDSKVNIFHLENNGENFIVKKLVNLPEECKQASNCMTFSADGRKFVLATLDGNIVCFSLKRDKFEVVNVFEARKKKILVDVIHLLSISFDGNYIVAGDRQSNIGVWSMKKYETSLPKYDHAPTAMAIHPTSNFLIVVYSDHKIVEFDLAANKYTKFTRSFPGEYPKQWTARCFPVEGIIFDKNDPNVFMLFDDSTICVIDKEKKSSPVKAKNKVPRKSNSHVLTTEGAEDENSQESTFFVLKKFKHLAFLNWLSQNEMVVIEVSPVSMLEKLPPALKIKRFGKL